MGKTVVELSGRHLSTSINVLLRLVSIHPEFLHLCYTYLPRRTNHIMPKQNSIKINDFWRPDKHKVLFETVFPASHQLVSQTVGEHLQVTSKNNISPNIWWAKHCDHQNICNSDTLVLISFSTQEGLTCLRTFKHPSCNFVVINDRNSRRHWACHMFQPHPRLRRKSTCNKVWNLERALRCGVYADL